MSGTTLQAGDSETIASGTLVDNVTLGFASELTVFGTVENAINTAAIAEVIIELGGTLIAATLGGANSVLYVEAGGAAIDTVLNRDAYYEYVYGVDSGANITGPDIQIVEAGGTAYGANAAAINLSLGEGGQNVNSGGTAYFTTIGDFDQQTVYTGGTATDSIINSGGLLEVYSGGVALGATINAGGKIVLAGAGSSIILNGGYLEVGGTLVGNISFTGSGSTIEIASTVGINGAIHGFNRGQTILLDSVDPASAGSVTFDNTDDILTAIVNGSTYNIQLDSSNQNDTFTLTTAESPSGVNFGTEIRTNDENILCFGSGTRLLMADGSQKTVEELRIDEFVESHKGPMPIKWIGKHDYDGKFIGSNRWMLPVLIKSGAIDKNVPSRDLTVSPGHGIAIDDVLFPARFLVNNKTILQAENVSCKVSYYHIELDEHVVLFAENCPTESYLDEGFRAKFHNAFTYDEMYPGAPPQMKPLQRIEQGFQLQAIQSRINDRAGIVKDLNERPGNLRGFVDDISNGFVKGWAQDTTQPEIPVRLYIFDGGEIVGDVLANHYRSDLLLAGIGNGSHGFQFALPPNVVNNIEVRRSIDGEILPLTYDEAAKSAELIQPEAQRVAPRRPLKRRANCNVKDHLIAA